MAARQEALLAAAVAGAVAGAVVAVTRGRPPSSIKIPNYDPVDVGGHDDRTQNIEIKGNKAASEFGLDSSFSYNDKSVNGFELSSNFVGQRLIVWDHDEKSYRRAVVTDVKERESLQVRFGDKMAETRFDGGPDAQTKKHVVAYENRDLLSDDEKWDIADEQFDLIPKGNDLDETAKDEINQVWREYTAAITNPDEAIELANNIKKFQKASPGENPSTKPDTYDSRTVQIRLHNPDSEFTSDRSKGRTKSIRHEMMHAYLIANGYDDHSDASRGDWDKVDIYKHTNEVDFDYVELLGNSGRQVLCERVSRR